MPEPVTLPEPRPLRATMSLYLGTVAVNFAITSRFSHRTNLHAPVPVQAPSQPANAESAAGAAVTVASVPSRYPMSQVAPQGAPCTASVPSPSPLPARCRKAYFAPRHDATLKRTSFMRRALSAAPAPL